MKLTQLAVALAAAFSLSAMAAGDQKQSPQAQSGQSKTQSSQGSQQQASASSQSPEVVKQAQEKLSAAGHDAGPADGVMGPKTQAALKEFQESKGLQASGELDQKTMAALGVSSSGSSSATAGASSDKSSSAGASSDKSSSAGASSSTSAEKSSDKKY